MPRRLRLVLLALASGAAAFWVGYSASVRVESSAAGTSGAGGAPSSIPDSPPPGPAGVAMELPSRPAFPETDANPFSPPAWDAQSSAAPGSRRRAPPPLPYRFVGRVYQDSGTQLFIARGTQIFPARKGAVLDGEYRIESVSGTELAFIHLPSGHRQVMQLTPPIEDQRRMTREASGRKLDWSDSLSLGRRVAGRQE